MIRQPIELESYSIPLRRAGLTIWQTGQLPGASRFWGPRA